MLYGFTGTNAGYPVRTDSYGRAQDTTSLTAEILAQVPDPPNQLAPPWAAGNLSVDGGGVVRIIGSTNYFSGGIVVADWLAGRSGPSGGGANLMTLGGGGLAFNYWGGYIQFWYNGVNVASLSGSKTFVIDHPSDPDRYLVHACLEGPEDAVFYRGEVRLDDVGRAEIQLPDYFPALVRADSESVQVTAVLEDEDEAIGAVAATRVKDGRFVIRGEAFQTVAWHVTATRADVPPLEIEPLKRDVRVRGDGPYRYVVSG